MGEEFSPPRCMLVRTVPAPSSTPPRPCGSTYRPTWGAGTLASDVVAGAPVLAGAAQLTVSPVASRWAQLLTVDSGVARGAEALARAGVAAGAMAALAWQLAALAMGPRRAELLTAPAPEASSTHASTRDGVAQGPVLALAPVAAVRAPVVAVAAARAVGPSPARLTVAGVRGNTAAMHTLLGAQGYAEVSALVVARAALGPPPVHGPETTPIRRLVTDPVPGALEPIEDVCASRVVDLVEGVCVRFLDSHGVALPVAAHIGVFGVQREDGLQEGEDNERCF